MPKIIYREDVKIIKKSFKQKFKTFAIFLSIVLVGYGCFCIASYLSAALTVGNLGSLIVYGDTKLKLDKSIMYAVMLGSYSDKDEASKVALGATIQGASGYVWEDGDYYVVGNIYTSKDDAVKVVENLKESKYKVSIKEINFPKLIFDFDMYSNSDMGVVKKAISTFDDIYDFLYNYSIKFDKGEVTNLAVSSALSEVRGELKALIVKVQKLINQHDSVLTNVQSALIKCDELLDQTIIKTIDNSSTNYSLKYSIASVVRIKFQLYNEFVSM